MQLGPPTDRFRELCLWCVCSVPANGEMIYFDS
jgi:hypothetical protein